MPELEDAPVIVLLATYNGELYLRDQIESLLAQTYASLQVMARDDGSTDGTWNLLNEYTTRFPERFKLLARDGSTGSAKNNFRRLLQEALEEDTSAYVAFSDQDDHWAPDKIALEMRALQELERRHAAETPLLVFSDLHLVDRTLSLLYPSFWRHQGINPENIHRFRRLLAQNVMTGCTALINRPLAVMAARMPDDAYMHDWWLALLASAFGDAAFLDMQTVSYRQHGGNVLGMVEPPKSNLIPKFRHHKERRAQWEMAAHQAEALLRVHGRELPTKSLRTLRAFLRCEQSSSRLVRCSSFLFGGFYFNTFRGNLVMLWYLWDMDYAKSAGAIDSRETPRAGNG